MADNAVDLRKLEHAIWTVLKLVPILKCQKNLLENARCKSFIVSLRKCHGEGEKFF